MKNILDKIPESIPEEIFETLLNTENSRIERIISKGQITPEGKWYDQEQHEWILVIQGNAKLLLEKQEGQSKNTMVTLNTGDYLNIPAHLRHRVIWTNKQQPTVWLAVHYDVLEK